MSSTNKTTYYELPQFVDNDIFNPLVDDNDAYSKIDTALHNIAGAEADDASEIVGIKSRLDSAEGDIDALEAQNGNDVLTTTAQTLSGAINEVNAEADALAGRVTIVEDDINNASTGLKAKVDDLSARMISAEGDIDAIEAQNGSETIETVSQTLSGGINELHHNVITLNKKNEYVTPELYGAIGDGITDDTVALQTAITDCETNNHVLVSFKGKIYKTTAPLAVTNCHIDFNGAKIDYHDTGYAIIINENDNTLDELLLHTNAIIENLVIDCNGESGINNAGIENRIKNIHVLNVGDIAILNRLGYETLVDDVYIEGDGVSTTNVGIKIETADGMYSNCIGKDVHYAFDVLNDHARIVKAHFWIGKTSLYSGSAFIYARSFNPVLMSDSTIDTYSIVVKYAENVSPKLTLTNCYIVYNNSYVTGNTYFAYLSSISTYRKYLDRDQLVNCFMYAPSENFYLCNLYEGIDWAYPMASINCRFPSRLRDYVNVTPYVDTPSNILAGKILVKYGDCIILNFRAKIEAGTNNIFNLKGVRPSDDSWVSCFAIEQITIPVFYGTSEYQMNSVQNATLLTADNEQRLLMNVNANVAEDTYVNVHAVIPFHPAEDF